MHETVYEYKLLSMKYNLIEHNIKSATTTFKFFCNVLKEPKWLLKQMKTKRTKATGKLYAEDAISSPRIDRILLDRIIPAKCFIVSLRATDNRVDGSNCTPSPSSLSDRFDLQTK